MTHTRPKLNNLRKSLAAAAAFIILTASAGSCADGLVICIGDGCDVAIEGAGDSCGPIRCEESRDRSGSQCGAGEDGEGECCGGCFDIPLSTEGSDLKAENTHRQSLDCKTFDNPAAGAVSRVNPVRLEEVRRPPGEGCPESVFLERLQTVFLLL